MLKKTTYLLSLLFVLCSCQSSSVRLSEVSQSLIEIKRAISASIPGGIKNQSINGRELSSEYFSRYGDGYGFDYKTAKERAIVKVLVLGDRRPYIIEVKVLVQRRVGRGKYEDDSYDKSSAERYAEAIKSRLVQSRDDRNVIDDFRVF